MKALIFLCGLWISSMAQQCDYGAVYNENFRKCYKFFNVPLSQGNANTMCAISGSTLVSIKSAFEQQFVNDRAKSVFSTNDYWTGGNDLTLADVYAWPDLTPMTYTNWQAGYPKSDFKARCVKETTATGKWQNIDCETMQYFVCEKYFPPTVLPTGGTWEYYKDTNSYYQLMSTNVTWDKYEIACKDQGGILSSIHSQGENDFIWNLKIADPKCWYIAIGYRSSPIGQLHFNWTDGTPTDYTNWKPTTPCCGECGFLNVWDGRWADFGCDSYRSDFCAACKRKA